MQQYTNWGESTLAAPILAGDLSLTVASAATFPASGDFYINLNDGINEEICKVTAVVGAVFTIVRAVAPSSAWPFLVGTAVTEINTAEQIDGIRADSCRAGTVAGLPAAATGKDGDLYFLTDGAHVRRNDAGSSWQGFGPVFNLPPVVTGDFAWLNQGTASLQVLGSSPLMVVPTTVGADDLRGQVKALANPKTVTAAFRVTTVSTGAGYTLCGIGVRDSAVGKQSLFGHLQGASSIRSFCPFLSHSANVNNVPLTSFLEFQGATLGLLWVQIEATATDLYYRWSLDGSNWVLYSTETIAAAGLAAIDQFLWFGYSRSSGKQYVNIQGWKES